MIPPKFEYEVAESVEHATELLGKYGGDAKLLAGGQSLLPLLKLRLADVPALVDIGRLDDLAYVREDGDRIAIGALTRHHDVQHDPLLREACPIVSYTASLIGDPQVRNRGTIATPPAVMNAVVDALTPLGVRDVQMPATPERVWRTIQSAKGGAS